MFGFGKGLAIIPARGGSKRVPKKNIKPLRGRTLIERAITVALGAKCFEHVLVSTDSDEIAKEAVRAGAEVPFIRPAELATDTADSLSVLLHAVKFAEKEFDKKFSFVVLIQPTSPFLSCEQLSAGIDYYYKNEFLSLSSMVKLDKPPEWAFEIDKNNGIASPIYPDLFFAPTKDLSKKYIENGAFYIINRDFLLENKSLYDFSRHGAYVMDSISSIDIDTAEDWEYAEYIASKRKL